MNGSPWRAFGPAFFARHQRALLWLLNAPVLRGWFRWVLRIQGVRSSVGRHRVTKILPHALFWRAHQDAPAYALFGWTGEQRAEFRTHQKFAKRLYFAFRPVWWALHWWDWLLADRWAPELSFGFATLSKSPDADPETTTVDGVVGWFGGGVSWATIVANTGNDVNSASTDDAIVIIKSSAASNLWVLLYRAIYLFDTSALGASATISAATMSVFGSGKADALGITPNVDVYTSLPASNTNLVGADSNTIGSVSQTGAPITYSGWSTSAYNVFTFNATGISNINKAGISKFGCRNASYDAASSTPTWTGNLESSISGKYAETSPGGQDPTLLMTYEYVFPPFPPSMQYVPSRLVTR